MRNARNFNPEWGYVASAPSVVRMARVIAVAAIIGAAAGAVTVFSCYGTGNKDQGQQESRFSRAKGTESSNLIETFEA